jgi:hypothetical protein
LTGADSAIASLTLISVSAYCSERRSRRIRSCRTIVKARLRAAEGSTRGLRV